MKKLAALALALGIVGGTSLAANAQYYNHYYVNTRPYVNNDWRLRHNFFNRVFRDRDDRRWERREIRHDMGLHRGWYRHW